MNFSFLSEQEIKMQHGTEMIEFVNSVCAILANLQGRLSGWDSLGAIHLATETESMFKLFYFYSGLEKL